MKTKAYLPLLVAPSLREKLFREEKNGADRDHRKKNDAL